MLVKAGYYGHNPPFTDLTITEAAFLLLITNYVTALAIMKMVARRKRAISF